MKYKPLTPEEIEDLTEEDSLEEYNKSLLSILKSINMAIDNIAVMLKKLDENYNSISNRLIALQEIESIPDLSPEKWSLKVVERDYQDLIKNVILERIDGYQA